MQFTKKQRDDINEAIAMVEEVHGVNVLQIVVCSSHAFDYGSTKDPLELDFVYVYPRDRYLNIFKAPEEKLDAVTNTGLRLAGQDLRRFVDRLASSVPSAHEFTRNEFGLFRGTAGFCGALEDLGKACFNSKSAISYLSHAQSALNAPATADFDVKKTLLTYFLNLTIAEYIMDAGRFPHPDMLSLVGLSKHLADQPLKEQILQLRHDRYADVGSVIDSSVFDAGREYFDYLHARYTAGDFKKDPNRRTEDCRERGDKFFTYWVNYFEQERLKDE